MVRLKNQLVILSLFKASVVMKAHSQLVNAALWDCRSGPTASESVESGLKNQPTYKRELRFGFEEIYATD